jgi:hypothetical protein
MGGHVAPALAGRFRAGALFDGTENPHRPGGPFMSTALSAAAFLAEIGAGARPSDNPTELVIDRFDQWSDDQPTAGIRFTVTHADPVGTTA